MTIQVYQKDLFKRVHEAVLNNQIRDIADFDWTKNPRFYWRIDEKEVGNAMVCITDVDFTY